MAGTKEWTLMFYFASDNPLAPTIVSQLKALKNAGFHPDANVVARFDPHTVGTPLHTFDVNIVPKLDAQARRDIFVRLEASAGSGEKDELASFRKRNGVPREYQVGFRPDDPYIRNLVLDKLWGNATIPNGGNGKKIKDLIEGKLQDDIQYFLKHSFKSHNGDKPASASEIESPVKYDPPDPDAPALSAAQVNDRVAQNGTHKKPARPKSPDKRSPREALSDFLQFCAREYPAQHYMLFILGHGLVVGNDTFLFDEHAAKPSLRLKELGQVVDGFNGAKSVGDLELIAFHSCSMSSIEVAYELEGKARYMLASQGPEFVGSWPYTQILVRVFNDLVRGEKNIEAMVEKIFSYCFYNSYDFQMAGYSFDLALCDLKMVKQTKTQIDALASRLMRALGAKKGTAAASVGKRVNEGDEFIRGLILLAHWDAQSFWRDTYTDLYDFCLCLYRRCSVDPRHVSKATNASLEKIREACIEVMKALVGGGSDAQRHGLIRRSGFAGPSYQYSHGLSVFFPWSQPSNDDFWPGEYRRYAFGKETKWRRFLQRYFDNTMREPRLDEPGHEYPSHLLNKQVQYGVGDVHRPESPRRSHESSDMLYKDLLEGITAHIFERGEAAQLSKGSGGDGMGKGSGSDATGDDCDCPSIKNYPSFTRGRRTKPTYIGFPRRR